MQPPAGLQAEQHVLVADAANQFFRDLYAAIEYPSALLGRDDQRIILFNSIIELARRQHEGGIQAACARAGVRTRAVRRILKTIVYLVRTPTLDENRRVLLAEVREKWRDTDGVERTTDLYGELERIIDSYLAT